VLIYIACGVSILTLKTMKLIYLTILALVVVALGNTSNVMPHPELRPAGRCVPAPDPAVCIDMPVKIGTAFRMSCERLNDPRKDDVMTGMPERCINAIERDGADCLQAALDIACSFHCGRCDAPWMARGYVKPICTHVCNRLIDACPTANNELNCFKHYDLRSNCASRVSKKTTPRPQMDPECEYVRGDLTRIISPSSTLTLISFVMLASAFVALVVF